MISLWLGPGRLAVFPSTTYTGAHSTQHPEPLTRTSATTPTGASIAARYECPSSPPGSVRVEAVAEAVAW